MKKCSLALILYSIVGCAALERFTADITSREGGPSIVDVAIGEGIRGAIDVFAPEEDSGMSGGEKAGYIIGTIILGAIGAYTRKRFKKKGAGA